MIGRIKAWLSRQRIWRRLRRSDEITLGELEFLMEHPEMSLEEFLEVRERAEANERGYR